MIDSHVHIWDSGRLNYPWVEANPELRGSYLPGEIDHAGVPVRGFVFVQAGCVPGQYLEEARWVSSLAPQWAGLRGIVAGVDLLDDAGLPGHLDTLAQLPLVVGVRHVLQGESAATLRSGTVRDGLRELAARGLVFDACANHSQLPALLGLLADVPELHVVLDHLGKPPLVRGIRSPEGRTWADSIDALAQLPHTWLKVSGLSAEAPPGTVLGVEAAGFIARAVDAFGTGRSMLGSDWPVSAHTGARTGFADWAELVYSATGADTAEQEALGHRTATNCYRLGSAPIRGTHAV